MCCLYVVVLHIYVGKKPICTRECIPVSLAYMYLAYMYGSQQYKLHSKSMTEIDVHIYNTCWCPQPLYVNQCLTLRRSAIRELVLVFWGRGQKSDMLQCYSTILQKLLGEEWSTWIPVLPTLHKLIPVCYRVLVQVCLSVNWDTV